MLKTLLQMETTAVLFCSDAACGQDAASSSLFLLLLSSLACPPAFLVRPLPHSPQSHVLLVYILICGSYPRCLCRCMCHFLKIPLAFLIWFEFMYMSAAPAALSVSVACCDVIDCYSHYHSKSVLSVGAPPPFSALQQHQPRAATCSKRGGCFINMRREKLSLKQLMQIHCKECHMISFSCQDRQQYLQFLIAICLYVEQMRVFRLAYSLHIFKLDSILCVSGAVWRPHDDVCYLQNLWACSHLHTLG